MVTPAGAGLLADIEVNILLAGNRFVMDEFQFQNEIRERRDAESAARRLLGVSPEAGLDEIKKAYRQLVKLHHPDVYPGEKENDRKFLLIKCAYEMLMYGKPCVDLTEAMAPRSRGGASRISEKYATENPWGFFLWWRDRFFDSG